MRIDDECRDPELLAAEVRRLRTVIAAGEPTLTDAEREAIEVAISALGDCVYGSPDPIDTEAATTLRQMLARIGK